MCVDVQLIEPCRPYPLCGHADELEDEGFDAAGKLLVGHLRIVLLRLYELMVEIKVVRRSCHKLTCAQKRLYQQAVQFRGRIEFIALACVGCIGRIARGQF